MIADVDLDIGRCGQDVRRQRSRNLDISLGGCDGRRIHSAGDIQGTSGKFDRSGSVGNETVYEEALSEYQYTDPSKAKEFVERTGCDSLAVAIGNVHGVYSSEPKLAFDVLEAVAKEVDVPLVLHGASGIGDEDIKKAISLGIAKINIHTELCQAAMEAINAHKDEPFLAVEREVRKAVKERAMYKIKLFGDDGRADE